jgi:predicted ester cyclase
MSTAENRALVHRYLDAISGQEKPAHVLDQYIATEDEALKQHIAAAEVAFPCYELIAEDLLADGDKVVVRFALRATHQGEFMGMPATGRTVNVPGIIIYRIANGKIAEHWMQLDSVALMQQLGGQM